MSQCDYISLALTQVHPFIAKAVLHPRHRRISLQAIEGASLFFFDFRSHRHPTVIIQLKYIQFFLTIGHYRMPKVVYADACAPVAPLLLIFLLFDLFIFAPLSFISSTSISMAVHTHRQTND